MKQCEYIKKCKYVDSHCKNGDKCCGFAEDFMKPKEAAAYRRKHLGMTSGKIASHRGGKRKMI